MARRPQFAIVGTGRCGTGYAALYLSQLGIRCSHEGYYTPDGPKLRNPSRQLGTRGDASWLAVPFLRRGELPVVHLVRHPTDVIYSLYAIGFFDPRFRPIHQAFIAFAERHFEVGSDPLDACVRWYLEWNGRCEEIAGLRIPVEAFEATLPQLLSYIDVAPTRPADPPSRHFNSRLPSRDGPPRSRIEKRIAGHPLAGQVAAMAARYGYDWQGGA